MSAGGGGELDDLRERLEVIERQIEALESEIEGLRAEKTEINEAMEGIETLESGDVVQVPLGGGAYVRAEGTNAEEIIIGFGGGYAGERDADGAISTLENKQDLLDERIAEVEEDIAELESESEQLEQRAQQLQQQQLQQLQQQMGQGQGQGPPGPNPDEDA